MRGSLFWAVLAAAAVANAQAASRYVDPDPDATRRVANFIASKDCTGAVAALNEGVKARQRDVLLLAGSMYDTGLCVKPNWERAAYFYQLADAAGNRDAIPRLAAGYALAGRDNAVALWWIAQRPEAMPPACIPQADPVNDAEGFEKELAAMPQQQLQACVYMTGVYASIVGETEFPVSAQERGVYGDIDMQFLPAEGVIHWHQGQRERLAAPLSETGRTATENSLLAYMRKTGERALARYRKPAGITPGTAIHYRFSFGYIN